MPSERAAPDIYGDASPLPDHSVVLGVIRAKHPIGTGMPVFLRTGIPVLATDAIVR